jgi:hypothetical protein
MISGRAAERRWPRRLCQVILGIVSFPLGWEVEPVPETKVLVETLQIDSYPSRQIGPKTRTTALLQDRRQDIEEAVYQAAEIVQDSVAKVAGKDGWHIKSLEAKFGLTLGVEAGVILSRASAEASFEVTITIEHDK